MDGDVFVWLVSLFHSLFVPCFAVYLLVCCLFVWLLFVCWFAVRFLVCLLFDRFVSSFIDVCLGGGGVDVLR